MSEQHEPSAVAPDPRPTAADGAYALPPVTFATAFREALDRRGLTLQRLHVHLAARGITISPVTLSHWQRGRSRPERPESLRAVTEAESILALPPGTLHDLLGPQRPRGRILPSLHNPEAAMQRVHGPGSSLEQVLGDDAFGHFNENLIPLTLHETIHLDEHGCIGTTDVTQVLRSARDGTDRVTVHHEVDDPRTPSVDLSVHCGTVSSMHFDAGLRSLVAEIRFGRPLARGETAIVEYTFDVGPRWRRSELHERTFRVSPRQYLLHAYFHPDALPVRCHKYYRERTGAPYTDLRPLVLDASHTAHALATKCSAGVYGMCWEWPEPSEHGEPSKPGEHAEHAGPSEHAGRTEP